MEQLRLPLYDHTNTKWMYPDPDLFTALLLECGPAPSRDHLAETFGFHPFVEYFIRVRSALEKYYLPDPDAPVPYIVAYGHKMDAYLNWLDRRKL